ncbi:MAG: hypothetical protein A2788_02020 [Candidatus Abawacabacteria bacterium RIFCSPHIGHO2_01_FULL_46_8]|uniref:Core domain-containing protein n=1 Tax=Candidatus Abawacabacteria bacterium RIFCSPHIGHO2_01_FULL_46_8 TaxID=1817815 RepID=A0A1F4XIL7_9BACT|nr:MAG: hypothetical protein A2788_02020 [Candidatus Abawacabacteria bacterium RIFCSPHIGHO2_01_FULL_46_8]
MSKRRQKITADMTVGKVMEIFPPVTAILARYGLACAGCSFNAEEAIGAGVRGHGYGEEDVEALLLEINEAIANYKVYQQDGVSITQAAIDKVHEFAGEQEREGYKLRLELEDEQNPAASQYLLDFAEAKAKDDQEIKFPGLDLIFAKKLKSHMAGVEIDWLVMPDGQSGFQIKTKANN